MFRAMYYIESHITDTKMHVIVLYILNYQAVNVWNTEINLNKAPKFRT